MAEGDATVANNFKEQLLLGTIDCDTDTFKVALSTGWTITADGASLGYSDITQEASGTGYTAGGGTVATPAVSQDDSGNLAKWDDDGSNITWSSLSTNAITSATLYDTTVNGSPICVMWEIATSSNGGDYTIEFASTGILTLA